MELNVYWESKILPNPLRPFSESHTKHIFVIKTSPYKTMVLKVWPSDQQHYLVICKYKFSGPTLDLLNQKS